jgi:hypothetical protein
MPELPRERHQDHDQTPPRRETTPFEDLAPGRRPRRVAFNEAPLGGVFGKAQKLHEEQRLAAAPEQCPGCGHAAAQHTVDARHGVVCAHCVDNAPGAHDATLAANP